MLAYADAKGAAMVLIDDDGDDLLRRRRRRQPSLKRIHNALDRDNHNLEEHEREGDDEKITYTTVHHDAATRLDARFDFQALGATKARVSPSEWRAFLGMEFGMVEDARGILRFHPAKRETVERDLTFAEVGKHYNFSESTVREYDRRARKVYGEELANVQYRRMLMAMGDDE